MTTFANIPLAIAAVLTFAGPASAGVSKHVRQRLHRALADAVGDSEAQIVVRRWRPSRPELLRRARGLDSLRLLPGERPYGQVTARARLRMARGTVAIFILADVEVRVPVWVAARRLGRGAPLSDWSVKRELRSLKRLPSNALRARASLAGQVAARALRPGTVLTRTAVSAPALVKRGDPVTVAVVVGGVIVRAEGRALQKGRRGDRIRVRLERSGRAVVTGRVEARNRVRVTQ